jgi:hypothetical protein
MDRFVNDRNLESYRKLACRTTTTAEREILFASRTEENVEFFRPRNARQDVRRGIALRVGSGLGANSGTRTDTRVQETASSKSWSNGAVETDCHMDARAPPTRRLRFDPPQSQAY